MTSEDEAAAIEHLAIELLAGFWAALGQPWATPVYYDEKCGRWQVQIDTSRGYYDREHLRWPAPLRLSPKYPTSPEGVVEFLRGARDETP